MTSRVKQALHHDSRNYKFVWIFTYLFFFTSGLLIQLVVLPFVFPEMHGGNGLIANRDWIGFHQSALAQAENISELGWGAFNLQPDGLSPISGILSIFYFYIARSPWSILPLNSALYASATTALYYLNRQIGMSNKAALICISPFIFFPSAAMEYAQIHKDVFCAAGFLGMLACLCRFLTQKKFFTKVMPLVFMGNIICILLIWMFRPYYLSLLVLFCAILTVFYTMVFISDIYSNYKNLTKLFDFYSFRNLFLKAAYLLFIVFFSSFLSNHELGLFFGKDEKPSSFLCNYISDAECSSSVIPLAENSSGEILEQAFVPKILERLIVKISITRNGFIRAGKDIASTNIDDEIHLTSLGDVIEYLPRALQIGLLAPFPDSWFDYHGRNSSDIEVFISSVEMTLIYICLLGWIYWMYSFRHLPAALVIPSIFCMIALMLLGLVVTNIGTIYRMRFPFEMVLVSFGIAGWIKIFSIACRSNYFQRKFF